MIQTNYNPDVLSCLANLSNDEVFTPPSLVNNILDLLPAQLWSDQKAKFLDPVSKSGVFLREMAKRLMIGLERQIPDRQMRINHIFSKQLYGIAITDLTALLSRRSVYCSKTANGKYSICDSFTDDQGNILYKLIKHTWASGRCTYCGASQEVYDREDALESYAYNFIHTNNPEKIFNMKFDVIVGNPPYQLSDAGHGRSASPIYHKFIEQAKKLNPKYLTMIIPARWYAGGKGLDEFRAEMLADNRIRKLIDFENSNDVFPGVDVAGGICYFLWDRDNKGLCEVVNLIDGKQVKSERALDEFSIFIRHSQAIPIIRKVSEKKENEGKRLSSIVSSRKPFGLPTNYIPQNSGIPCWFIQKIGLKYANKNDVSDDNNVLDKWKLLLPPAPIAGQTDFSKPVGFYYDGNTRIAKPGECCTESFIVAGAFSTEKEVLSFKSYLFTKIVRFLLLQTVVSQHVTKDKFQFIPDLGKYEGEYTDKMLIKRWGINDEEWNFIDSKIKNIGTNENIELDE
ncbi:restriction endonuclease [Flavobacterium zepuense]|uniref:site-specific DNA-methyltransferase (adenine-specific) n=1 Tax=Flavobacterium zepuense TaxID=2593302 RepID=A0A552V691_9FLAO|nr:Eco57I restriction-modification methylase domain-containing protein [Flavobacterium zepuense]TRW25962.1 restriction endonuclease [Flavobacterium zepuense]